MANYCRDAASSPREYVYELRLRVLRIDTRYALDTAGESLHEYRPVGATPRFLWIDLAVASSPVSRYAVLSSLRSDSLHT